MRIISGQFRGKKLVAPQGLATRPTSDRAKETLFNLLTNYLLKSNRGWADVSFADVFAGSGAIGIEAASRGARPVFLFETAPEALAAIRQNSRGISGIDVYATSALTPPPPRAGKSVDFIFMDAPYGKQLWQKALMAFRAAGWISTDTLAVIETDARLAEEAPAGWQALQDRHAGRNRFLFLTPKA